MRPIDADALKKMVGKSDCLSINLPGFASIAIAGLKTLIDEQPTVDAVPVVHGAWEEETVGSIEENAVIADWQSARCSACKRYLTTPYMYYFEHYNYCPNCGADMRDGERKDT